MYAVRNFVNIRDTPIINNNAAVVKCARYLSKTLFGFIFSYVNAKQPKQAITAIIEVATSMSPEDALSVGRLLVTR